MKELIEYLEKEGFIEEANSLRNGGASLKLSEKNIGGEEVKDIANALKTNTSLTQLNLGSNQIGDEGAKALAEVLKTNNFITELNLRKNQIKAEGVKALAEVFKTNNSITQLVLGWNYIGDEEAKALAEGLKNNNSIKQLALGWNEIGYAGAKSLAELLKTNNSITSFDLSDNKIEDEGTKALCEGLKNNNSLTQLNLSQNRIGDAGAKAIAELLKTNSALVRLDSNENTIGNMGAKEIARALKSNTTLIEFRLRDNSITEGREIEERICYNKELVEKLSLLLSCYKEEVSKEKLNVDYAFKVLTASKFYQVVNKQLLKESLQEQGIKDVETKLKDADDLIKMNPFTVAGVCKNIQPNTKLIANDVHISHLPKELIARIASYLEYTNWGKWVINATSNKRKHEIIEDDIDQLNQQKKVFHNITMNKIIEIIYDKPLLDHPELLQAAMEKFSLKKIGELSTRLSLELIAQAVSSGYNDGGELILSGLMSLEYNEAPAG